MDTPNFETVYKIFEGYPEKLSAVKEWEKEYRRAALTNNLYEHQAIKDLLTKLRGFNADIDARLRLMARSEFANDNLYFDERTKLETEARCWHFLIHIFTIAQSKVGDIAGKVDETVRINT